MACYTSPCLLLVLSKLSHKYSTFIQLPTWKPSSAQERTGTISENFCTEKYELMWFTEGTGGYAVRAAVRAGTDAAVLCLALSVYVCVECVFLSLRSTTSIQREDFWWRKHVEPWPLIYP